MDTTPTAPAAESKERHLTVSRKWFTRTRRNIEAPEIRLAGVYLQKLGFTIGSKVTVIEKPGEIIVRLDGLSAERDPNETADDRRYARKVKKITDYQKNAQRPLSEEVVSQYLSGEMSFQRQGVVSRLIDGEVPESHQAWAYGLLHSELKPATDDMECQSLIWHLDQLPPKPRRKRAAKPATQPGIIKHIQTKTTKQTQQAVTVQGNRIKPPADQQVAEPAQEEVQNAGRNHVRDVLRSLGPYRPLTGSK